ncbi:unnamed protein product [Moneuplotes crassus]|uniref:AP2/ERF domain-containing protein n=1 Tax=Euplotes crassus TaxID=5936 RepID=A0AAD1U143_EUPCR|nr:unnamed protein product [Moneuplotes crassus]
MPFVPQWDYQELLIEFQTIYCICPPSIESITNHKCYELPLEIKREKSTPSSLITDTRSESSVREKESHPELKNLVFKITRAKPSNGAHNILKRCKESNQAKVLQKRKSRAPKLEIRQRLIRLRQRILEKNISGFTASVKRTRYTTNKYLGRRSKYIGISKNNTNWQALINVNHAKKYIGTFLHELDAARTYDLYSVAMQGEKGLLNFSYTDSEMVEMISYFLDHGSVNPQHNLSI